MNILYLTYKEILHRFYSFFLGAMAVAFAVAALASVIISIRAYDVRTDKMVQARQKAIEKEMAQLNNEMRKITKGLGFNIYIFPKGQNLAEVYSEGYASKTMPESYVDKLANSKIVTINHLLPSLTEKIFWKEQSRTIMLIGIRGEVPIMFGKPKKAMVNPVKDGHAVVGYELHKSLGIKPDDSVSINGHKFIVQSCNKMRGNIDDISIWISLDAAQKILNKPGKINAILALECNCSSVERLGEIRKELEGILPGVKVIEKESKALARAEAREKTKSVAFEQIRSIKKHREEFKNAKATIFKIMIFIVIMLVMGFIAYLTYINVNDRIKEIGILLAIGNDTVSILSLFLFRALIMGLIGLLLGGLTVVVFYFVFKNKLFLDAQFFELFKSTDILYLILGTFVLTFASSWLPAFYASQKEPSEILRKE